MEKRVVQTLALYVALSVGRAIAQEPLYKGTADVRLAFNSGENKDSTMPRSRSNEPGASK